MPKVSVVMPVYNASRFLNDSINSILNQTLDDLKKEVRAAWESLVNNDEIDADLNRVDYLVDSTMFDDDSGYKFFFEDNKLCEVHMSWLP